MTTHSQITIKISVDICLIGSISSICLKKLSKKSNTHFANNSRWTFMIDLNGSKGQKATPKSHLKMTDVMKL